MTPALGGLVAAILLLPGVDLIWNLLHRGAMRDQKSVAAHRRHLRRLGQIVQKGHQT